MDENEESTINSIGKEEEKRKQKQEEKNNKENKPRTNIVSFIMKHFPIIIKVAIIIFAIFIVIGIIQLLITMPGLILGRIKAFARNIWGDLKGSITGDNISPTVSKEDEMNLAKYIQDMGYDVIGYGFGDMEYDEEGNIIDITKENDNVGVRQYLKSYIVQNEAIYTLTEMSDKGFFSSLFSSKTAEEYSKGMIHIVKDRDDIDNAALYRNTHFEIDREKKMLRVNMGTSGFLSQSYYYFNMADWTSRYGKPIELFLSLHLSTMMPDLSYDLATAECFNTKVNIEIQEVQANYGVSYTNNGETANKRDIEKAYIKARWNVPDSIINAYTGEDFEKLYDEIISYSKRINYSSSKGIDMTYIEDKLEGKTAKDPEEDYTEEEQEIEVPIENSGSNGNNNSYIRPNHSNNGGEIISSRSGIRNTTTNNNNVGSQTTTNNSTNNNASGQTTTETITVKKYRNHTFYPEIDQSQWRLTGVLGNLTTNQLQGLVDLIEEGKKSQTLYWPRIRDVENHWYYNEIKFTYGRAETAKKTIKYEPEDPNNKLYGVSGIVLDTTMTSNDGIYYQLCNPEATGPNDAIIALFKGGEGTLNGSKFSFPGEYYRYDGTRQRAREIANARAVELGGGLFSGNQYTFMGTKYDQKEVSVTKEPVVFYDSDNNNSYKNAFSAFAILENSHTEEAESAYRNLKELLIYLDYFTEEELKDPMSQVLEWFMPDNLEESNLVRDVNKFGITVKDSLGKTIIAPGDGKIINKDGDTLTIQFSVINEEKLQELKEKYKDELYYIDSDAIIDMQMVISGINSNIREGAVVTTGTNIGTASRDDVQVYLKYSDGSIVDNITKYMSQTSEEAKVMDDFGK